MEGHTSPLHKIGCEGASQIVTQQVQKVLQKQRSFLGNASPSHHQTPYDESTATTSDASFTAAMGYAAGLEEKAHTQAKCILELKASVDGQTILTEAINYAASTVTAGGNNKYLKDLRLIMKQLTASVTARA